MIASLYQSGSLPRHGAGSAARTAASGSARSTPVLFTSAGSPTSCPPLCASRADHLPASGRGWRVEGGLSEEGRGSQAGTPGVGSAPCGIRGSLIDCEQTLKVILYLRRLSELPYR